MKNIDLRELQLIELDILKCFADFCEQNGLRYYLDSGTLIGAIRHNGFIPWDDDVDVCMLRADYNRFVDLLHQKGNRLAENIVLETEADSYYPYLKLVDTRTVLVEYPSTNPLTTGIYIDIFPKDGIVSVTSKEQRRAKKIKRYILFGWVGTFTYTKLLRSERMMDKLKARIIKVCIPNPPKWKDKAIRLAQKNNATCFSYVTSLVCSGMGGCVPLSCFEKQVEVSFEGFTFKAPIGYDRYLKTLYSGDYMIPPPPEKRTAHEAQVYWKEAEE